MNKQRKVLITTTYNEMGIIIDTKAEELGSFVQPEPCEDAVSRKAVQYLLAHFVDEDKYVDACDGLKHLPHVTPKQPDCAKCKSELANKIRGQQDNPGMLTENDKGRNWGLEWAAQIVEGKRR